MTGTTNKQIARLKRILSILVAAAVILSIVTTVSGFCFFRNLNSGASDPDDPIVPETTEATLPQESENEDILDPEETDTQPAETMPEETMPAETAPAETMPEETMPGEMAEQLPSTDSLAPPTHGGGPGSGGSGSGGSGGSGSGSSGGSGSGGSGGSGSGGSGGSGSGGSGGSGSGGSGSGGSGFNSNTPNIKPENSDPKPGGSKPESYDSGSKPNNPPAGGDGSDTKKVAVMSVYQSVDITCMPVLQITHVNDPTEETEPAETEQAETEQAETEQTEMDPQEAPETATDPLPTEVATLIVETAPPITFVEDEQDEEPANPLWLTLLFFGSAFLLLADIIAIFVVSAQIRKLSANPQKTAESYGVTVKKVTPSISDVPTVGRAHAIGMRNYQQDSFGQIPILKEQGLLAVVADGMGGLSDGEKVSQRIVMKALDYGVRLTSIPNADTMVRMVNMINQDVNQMLGEENLFKSGSTLVATMVVKDHLWWTSVGDSRIYLYRSGYLTQLTRDHDLLQEWMGEVSKGRMTYEQATSNPDGRKLTSFIGMGKLRYIGYNQTPVLLQPGDRILLMSDGVYGTVSNDEMIQILKHYPDVQAAADAFSRKIEAAKRRHQDNYTIMILGM